MAFRRSFAAMRRFAAVNGPFFASRQPCNFSSLADGNAEQRAAAESPPPTIQTHFSATCLR
jgi:hypothetical protein